MENQEEIWKDILGCEGRYQVSNKGNVRSLCKEKVNITNNFLKVLKLEIKFGYLCANVYRNGKKWKVRAHRAVAIAFLSNPKNKQCVNHIDGNKLNNNISNLEWCTHRENTAHAIKMGLAKIIGIENGVCKLTNEQVLRIREMSAKGMSSYKIAKEIATVSPNTINSIAKRKTWKHI